MTSIDFTITTVGRGHSFSRTENHIIAHLSKNSEHLESLEFTSGNASFTLKMDSVAMRVYTERIWSGAHQKSKKEVPTHLLRDELDEQNAPLWLLKIAGDDDINESLCGLIAVAVERVALLDINIAQRYNNASVAQMLHGKDHFRTICDEDRIGKYMPVHFGNCQLNFDTWGNLEMYLRVGLMDCRYIDSNNFLANHECERLADIITSGKTCVTAEDVEACIVLLEHIYNVHSA